MAHLDLTFAAQHDASGPDNGMRLAEVEDALRAARTAGAQDSTRVHVRVSLNGRVRQLRVEVRPDDQARDEQAPPAPAEAVPEDPPEEPSLRVGPRRVRDAPQA